ncbi:dephospho-CoA kinase [Paenibacillus phyllosphaerae]|uniref:Dephospho-CoA kinase n=1 Tax=Paenibacillus phyllosphaerae TaxID=274593 RepID=A0A7W5AVK1_9BACL|nr:dephospho-CoA kinase [Paenibacillus phyllosphaerae]MBB3109578.1 dephospho-CoA kinase [Paenibacillus phyllosphaerae]
MRLGLTGGIACGKSTVSAMLVSLGAKLVDADRVAREVVLPGEPALTAIVDRFGQEVLAEDLTLDRRKLGGMVFSDPDKLKDLEAILHPAIRERMHSQVEAYTTEDPAGLVIVDIPLLYETGQADVYDAVMVVYIPRSLQVERLMARNSLERSEAERRVGLQMDIEEKRERADFVIDNSGDLEATRAQVERFWREQGLP